MESPFYYIPDSCRRLMLKILNDEMGRLEEIVFLLQYIYEHMPKGKNEAALQWLVRNNVVGKDFLGFYFIEAKESPLELIRVLTARIHKTKELRPLIFRRDVVA